MEDGRLARPAGGGTPGLHKMPERGRFEEC